MLDYLRWGETDRKPQAKINNLGIASLAYNTKVNSGLTFGIGGSFDTQKLNEAGHKLGTSFTFEG
jgi:voltage-dependent anion channel protein 2